MGTLPLFIVLATAAVMCDMQEQLNLSGVGSPSQINSNDSVDEVLIKNGLIVSFVVFRHGDRTPEQDELDLYPAGRIDDKAFYPTGKKALTVKGKQRAYVLGEYLRKMYNDSINQLYLPEEIIVRTTDVARTKMTALSVLAGLYPPLPVQKWHPDINWQPIPYNTVPSAYDDLLYFGNCARYGLLKNSVYESPMVRNIIDSYEDVFKLLSAQTGANITTTQDVFFLDNLFQAMENAGLTIPQWAQDVMPQIKNLTKIEYWCMYYDRELIKLTSGVLMADIVNTTKAAIAGNKELAKLYLYSAHELNVAAVLAALGVFVPHQPNYASAVILELRRNLDSGKYGVMVVYAAKAGGPGEILPIANCGGNLICDYDKFITLIQDLLLSPKEYRNLCSL